MLSVIKTDVGFAQFLFVVAAIVFVILAIVSFTVTRKPNVRGFALLALAIIAVAFIYSV